MSVQEANVNSISHLEADNNKIYDNSSIANHLNDFFSKVGSNLANEIKRPTTKKNYSRRKTNSNSIFLKPTNEQELMFNYDSLRQKFIISKSRARNKPISLPKVKLGVGKKNHKYNATKHFNEMPIKLKNLSYNTLTIKKKLKNWMVANHQDIL